MGKYIIILVLLGVITSSSKMVQEIDLLEQITHKNTLTLIYSDGKCGEWGSNKEIITIYRTDFKSKIYADYLYETIDCKEIDSVKFQVKVKRTKVRLTKNDTKKIIESINQLSSGIMASEDMPKVGDIYCQIYLSNSSISLKGTPSIKWTKFEQLKKSILKN